MPVQTLALILWTAEPAHWWAASDWWLVIMAAITASVICWQSWETRKAAQASKDGVELVLSKERARLTVKSWRHLWYQSGAIYEQLTAPGIDIQIKNWGPTHAFNVRFLLAYATTEFNIPVVIPEMKEIAQRETTVPGDSDRHIIITLELKDREMICIVGGTIHVHVAGMVTYTDVFGKDHKTAFRYLYVGDQCATHGHSDENLED